MADQPASFALPARIQRAIDHAVLCDGEDVLVAVKNFLVVHDLGLGTRRHQDRLAQVPLEELCLPVGQTVEHLRCTLVVADVCDLFCAGHELYLDDESGQVVLRHLRVRPIPHFSLVLLGHAARLQLAVVASSIVPKPHIVASVEKLERNWLPSFLFFEPDFRV